MKLIFPTDINVLRGVAKRPWFILSVGMLLVGILMISETKPLPNRPAEVAWPVSVYTIHQQDYPMHTIVFGKVESLYSTTLRAGTAGYIHQLAAQEGLQFQRGDTLVTLDPIDAQLAVDEKAHTVEKLKALIEAEKIKFSYDKTILSKQENLIEITTKSVARQKDLAKRNVASQANIETAELELFREYINLQNRKLAIDDYPQRLKQLQADLSLAETALKQAELDLSRTQVTAPFAGRISRRFVSLGDRVQVNQELISLYDVHQLEIRAQFPTQEIALLQSTLAQQLPVQATLMDTAMPLTAILNRLSGEITTKSAGIEALFKINSSQQSTSPVPLRVGQSVKLRVEYPSRIPAFAVPYSALYPISNGFIVYKTIAENSETRLKATQVQVQGYHFNAQNEKLVLITSPDLQSNDAVLSTHLPNARDNLRVDIRDTL